jgi:hypothetical protein
VSARTTLELARQTPATIKSERNQNRGRADVFMGFCTATVCVFKESARFSQGQPHSALAKPPLWIVLKALAFWRLKETHFVDDRAGKRVVDGKADARGGDGVDAHQALLADGRARSDGFPLAGGSFKGVHMPRFDPLATIRTSSSSSCAPSISGRSIVSGAPGSRNTAAPIGVKERTGCFMHSLQSSPAKGSRRSPSRRFADSGR